MEIFCELCDNHKTIDTENAKCPNDVLSQAPGWELDDAGTWICPDHPIKQFEFKSVSIINARDMDAAKFKFADNSCDFAANAECTEVIKDEDDQIEV